MADAVLRSWQLMTVGPGSRHVTPDLHERLVRLFDLLPQTRLIEIETDAGGVSVSRDWPGDRMEEVSAIEAEIAAMPGISRLTLFQAAS
ncbi:hypothetical protein ASE90_09705 [Sphingomonas sp. Leaf67]|uniref:hypothetical protein n=1 Tax=Sphingomonas sp. Leaf67 TaxID=1736230 RepID=UPI0006FF6739|nr:hypothetical protein [Sphingomonas sp. Leaf67]KQN83015.1 hypothetical protein ASE90_09705 [Sphingomonas sp. Leaf67]